MMTKCPSDEWALHVIEHRYSVIGGIIRPRFPTSPETPTEIEAINYLCSEWDYDYEGM